MSEEKLLQEKKEYVNMNEILIKHGGRNAVKVSKEFILNELFKLHKKSEESEDIENSEQFTEKDINYYVLLDSKKIEKDLSKISFDGENYYMTKDEWNNGNPDDGNYIGINTLENGLTFLGCAAGGDWECTVFFIIYWDGKALRGYIPSYGNTVNLDFKSAFGSEGEYGDIDEKAVLRKPKYKDYDDDKDDLATYYLKCEGLSEDKEPDINWEAVKKDIENRIIVK